MSVSSLRPARLSEFSGQDSVKDELAVILGAARKRGQLPSHLLFSGPPGLGKTTLAHIIAAELDVPLLTTSAPMVEKPVDLLSLLLSMTTPSVLFIDEIHQLKRTTEETLYSAMEDHYVDIILSEEIGKAKSLRMQVKPFTLVGATTRSGQLSGPFRDRFGYVGRLKPYDVPTLVTIARVNSRKLGVEVSDDGLDQLARRSRGTPRILNKLLGNVADWAITSGRVDGVLSSAEVLAALSVFGVDSIGLDELDRDILKALCVTFSGGPVGLGTLATAVGETPQTLEEAHEPYLMRCGLLARTPKGRVATATTFSHLGLPVPAHLQSPSELTLDLE